MENSNKAAFGLAVGAMLESFGVEATKAILHGYWLGLNDLTISQIETAVSLALRRLKFVPKPFELRELLGLVITNDSRAEAAWSDVHRAIPFGPYKHVDFDDKLVNATIRNLGGWVTFLDRFQDSESEKWARLDFMKCYKAFANSGVTGDLIKPLAGLSQAEVVSGSVASPVPKRIGCDADRIDCRLRVLDSSRELQRLT